MPRRDICSIAKIMIALTLCAGVRASSSSHSFSSNVYRCTGVTAGYSHLIDPSARDWHSYPTVGLRMDVSTYVPSFHLRASWRAGATRSRGSRQREIVVMHLAVLGLYDFVVSSGRIGLHLRPLAGISSTAARLSGGTASSYIDITGDWENEFGVCVAFETAIDLDRVEVAVPVFVDHVFSSPHPLSRAGASLCIGLIW